METKSLREKSLSELHEELISLMREQFNLRMQRGTGQMTRTHQFKMVKRNIARVKTIMREKELKGESA